MMFWCLQSSCDSLHIRYAIQADEFDGRHIAYAGLYSLYDTPHSCFTGHHIYYAFYHSAYAGDFTSCLTWFASSVRNNVRSNSKTVAHEVKKASCCARFGATP